MVYASVEEFRARHGRTLPEGITDQEIGLLLADATVFLRSSFINIPDNPEGSLREVLRVVAIALAKRTLLSEKNDGAESVTDTAGPFSTTQSFRNSEGNFYISGQERAMIENELAKAQGNQQFRCITAEGW